MVIAVARSVFRSWEAVLRLIDAHFHGTLPWFWCPLQLISKEKNVPALRCEYESSGWGQGVQGRGLRGSHFSLTGITPHAPVLDCFHSAVRALADEPMSCGQGGPHTHIGQDAKTVAFPLPHLSVYEQLKHSYSGSASRYALKFNSRP